MEHGFLYGPPANRKLRLVAANDSHLSIRPVASDVLVPLACMLKPHALGPISEAASDAPEVQTEWRVRRVIVCAMQKCFASCGRRI